MSRDEVPREPRYPVRLTMRYRLGHERTWREGETQNISSSGVLFDAGNPLPEPSVAIEMNLMMPPEIVGAAATRVVCLGTIARVVEPQPHVGAAVAATITRYRLERSDRGRVPR